MYFRESELLRQRHPELSATVDAVDGLIGRARETQSLQVTVSFVARKVEHNEHDVGVVLEHLVAGGVLTRKFLFRCPVRTSGVRLYEQYAQIPEMVTCDLCEEGEHRRTDDDVFVVYLAARMSVMPSAGEKEVGDRPFVEGASSAPVAAADSVSIFRQGVRGAMELIGRRPTVLILTALPKELAAVVDVLDGPTEVVDQQDANVRFRVGTVPSINGGQHHVAVAVLNAMGNTSAGTHTATLSQQLPYLQDVVMVGIAGGVPSPSKVETHVRLGDVVVSRSVVEFDLKKEELPPSAPGQPPTPKTDHRGEPKLAAAKYSNAMQHLLADELRGDRSWFLATAPAVTAKTLRPSAERDVLHDIGGNVLPHPDDPRRAVDVPRMFFGCIASSNTLLKNPVARDELSQRHGALAVEMEGAGVASATWLSERTFCLVRGICDYCDSHKNDDWQAYAAMVAAVFSRALLGRFAV